MFLAFSRQSLKLNKLEIEEKCEVMGTAHGGAIPKRKMKSFDLNSATDKLWQVREELTAETLTGGRNVLTAETLSMRKGYLRKLWQGRGTVDCRNSCREKEGLTAAT